MRPIGGVRKDRRAGAAGIRFLVATLSCAVLGCALSALALDANRDYFVSFKSQTYTDPEKGFICLPRECLSFVRFHSAAKPRPLLVGGWGKDGILKLKASPNDEMVLIDVVGTGVVEFTEFAPAAAGDVGDFVCSEWVRQPPDLTLWIHRIVQWEEETRTMSAFCDLFAMPRGKDSPAPVPIYKALADIEFRCGGKSVMVPKVPLKVEFKLRMAEMWGMTRLYWEMSLLASGSFSGQSLGLTGGDAGEIRFDLVTAGLRPMPPTHRTDVSLDGDGLGVESLGVSHE